MKKISSVLLALAMVLMFAGCGKAEQESARVYSFHGENELLSVTNGVMVMEDGKDVFHGGDLQVAEEVGTDIVSYTTRFYFLLDGEREDFFRMVLVNAGEMLLENRSLGSISGNGVFHKDKIQRSSFDSWKDSLFFELTTVDKVGTEQVYTLPMTITEVTG